MEKNRIITSAGKRTELGITMLNKTSQTWKDKTVAYFLSYVKSRITSVDGEAYTDRT